MFRVICPMEGLAVFKDGLKDSPLISFPAPAKERRSHVIIAS